MTMVLAMVFLDMATEAQALEAENKHVGLYQTKKFLHSKRFNKMSNLWNGRKHLHTTKGLIFPCRR